MGVAVADSDKAASTRGCHILATPLSGSERTRMLHSGFPAVGDSGPHSPGGGVIFALRAAQYSQNSAQENSRCGKCEFWTCSRNPLTFSKIQQRGQKCAIFSPRESPKRGPFTHKYGTLCRPNRAFSHHKTSHSAAQ